MVIERRWQLIAEAKENYFFCYRSADDFHAGNNFTTKSTLREAKKVFECTTLQGKQKPKAGQIKP
jgi:hypothetical protein